MQFPFVNRFTPIQETGGADSYRVPDRRRVLKLGTTSLIMPFLLGRLLRQNSLGYSRSRHDRWNLLLFRSFSHDPGRVLAFVEHGYL
jgi:hypothetical protein